ncbi:MAG: hypothetical protein IPM54_43965 [Polyangiaceae bacterium]|nr:hypothetical protein [Polyangiaceae bacterium]
MATVSYGTVSLTIADALTPPAKAGNLSADEVRRLPKAPRGIGLAGAHTADAIGKAGTKLTLPADITAEILLAVCQKAEDIDQVIIDLEVVLTILKQANLLFDAEAWEMLRRVNDQVKAQAKYAPELEIIFRTLFDFMSRKRSSSQGPTEG